MAEIHTEGARLILSTPIVLLFSSLWISLICLPVRTAAQQLVVASGSDIEKTIQKLPKELTYIKDYLKDPNTQWKRHVGNLSIEKSFSNTEALIVDGNFSIKGDYEDYRDGIGSLVVLGDMQVDNMISWGSIAVTGKLTAKGLVYAYYNDYTFEAASVAAKALVIFDKGSHVGQSKVDLFLTSSDPQDEELISRAIRIFAPEVIAPELRDYIGDEFERIFPNFEVCRSRLAAGKSVFRENIAEPMLLDDLKKAIGAELPPNVQELIGKDRLLKMAVAMRDDLPGDLLKTLSAEKDPEIVLILRSGAK